MPGILLFKLLPAEYNYVRELKMTSPKPEEGGTGRLSDNAYRYYISFQRNRAVVYSFAVVVGFIYLLAIGELKNGYAATVGVWLVALLSAWILTLHYKRALQGRGPAWNLHFVWIITDALLITWGIHITGDYSSVWYPWFLANISGATFALGQKGGFFAAIVDTAGYEILMTAVYGGSPPEGTLLMVFFRMVCLYGASVFFLKGATDLRKKREVIKKLMEADAAKVKELTTLTENLNRRSEELAAANLRISEADHMKSVFLANMSHELRTPLNSIIGFSEVLASRLEGDIDQKFMGFIDNIHTSGTHLLEIINDILDLSKIEAGKGELNISEVALPSVVESVKRVIKGVTRQRSISVETSFPDDLPNFQGDAVRIKQILYNLLSNAVKFSYDGGRVVVAAGMMEVEESPLKKRSIFFSVKDDGIGIAPADHENIFNEFQQAEDSLSRSRGGTGLGLAITSRLVDLHGGSIFLESKLGEGSTFTVVLPLKSARRNVPEVGVELHPLKPQDSRPRILVVEDDPVAYERVAEVLSREGFFPVRSRRGEEVEKAIESEHPAAVILDIVLPGMDGWEVLKKLRRNPRTMRLPVIIVSIQENRELGLALGADDYFVKPVNFRELMERLTILLSNRRDGKARLLLIDDDPSFHELMKERLPSTAFELKHAFTGREGTKIAVNEPLDLIVLDLMMEEMDGFEVASFLKRHPVTAGIPVLILTSKELTEPDREKLAGKIDALVQKGPRGFSGLPGLIERLLTRKQGEGHG